MSNAQQRATATEIGDAGTDHAVTEDHATERRPAPSWFAPSFKTMAPEDIAERYRALRPQAGENGKPSLLDREIRKNFELEDEPFETGNSQQRTPPVPPRPLQPRRHIDDTERYYAEDKRPRSKPPLYRPRAYVAAGIAAVLAGGVLGYAASHYQAIGAKAQEIASQIMPRVKPVTADPVATAATETIVTKKPIATATLTVADVSGTLNSMIPLMLHAEPAAGGEDLILKISGLPQSAYLTAGSKADNNAWQLSAAEADGVKLVVPQTSEPSFDVAVAAFEAKTGELAAPVKEITVAINDAGVRIAPAAGLPEGVIVKTADQTAAPAAAALPVPKEEQQVASATAPAEAQSLMAKGDVLLKSGDLAMARLFYERAFAQGSVDAAIGAGKTYDPAVYAELKVQGLKPDAVRAMEWYMRASAAGNKDAAAAIEALKQASP